MPQKQRKALRKREYVKYVKFLRKQLRRRNDIEVKSTAGQWGDYLEHIGTSATQEAATTSTMQADAFWKNYAVAQEWQNRHSITWWRSRCIALEQENEILRNKVRSLAHAKKNYARYCHKMENGTQKETATNEFELNVTEEMLDFLETSERHRRERCKSGKDTSRKKRTKEETVISTENIPPENIHAKRKEAELLYGDAAPKILAMEAALQVAANRYKDSTNAQYWPNIPLKP